MVIELVIKWVVGIALGAISTIFLIFKKDIVEYITFKRKQRYFRILSRHSQNYH